MSFNTKLVFSYKGSIELVMGPMFSGKTTKLLQKLNLRRVAKMRCLLVKYSGDTRYDKDRIVSHDGLTKDIVTVSVTKLSELPPLDDYDVIGIDEGQFFPDIADVADDLADQGKEVVVAALSSTWKREGWVPIMNLIPKCEYIEKCRAICMICFKRADFSKRTNNSTEEKDIGGEDKYKATCRSCYNKQ